MSFRTTNGRRGFTLIELLVVISMILVLATLAVLIVPRLGDDQKSVRSADQVSMWLLISKQRAYRDQSPRGVRLVPSLSDPTQVNELVYIERPEDFIGGWKSGGPVLQVPASPAIPPPNPGAPATAATAVFGYDPRSTGFIHGKDLTNGKGSVTITNLPTIADPPPIVEPGDLLVYDTLEIIPYNSHRIAALYYVPPGAVPAAPNGGTYLVFASADGRPSQVSGNVPRPMPNDDTYRIVRRERPMAGEAVLQLPKDMIIDITYPDNPDASFGIQGYSRLPSFYAGNPSYDIVFNQRGQLMGANAIEGKVILRIRNGSKPPNVGDQFLVVVYGRTGLIAVHPMDLTQTPLGSYADPFVFTKDGKASGL